MLAIGVAVGLYKQWRTGDVRSLERAQVDHIASFASLAPGKDVSLLAFPATERFDEVPRFTARLNEWRVRERSFAQEPSPGVARIMAVGESSTFGTGLDVGERFTELLGVQLQARHPGCCEVLNCGRMGMRTETAVRFVMSEVAAWKPSVLIYDSMANDLVDGDATGVIDVNNAKIDRYRQNLERLVAFCAERGIKVVFWANTIAQERDPLLDFKAVMRDVAEASGSGYVDLGELYHAHPATAQEIAEFQGEPNWTQWFDVVRPPALPLSIVALHTDWVHPNRFGSQRLAAGLLPLVESSLALGSP